MLSARALRHVRPIQPLHFPCEESEIEYMGQSGRHFELCVALYQILRAAIGPSHTVACDQFHYFDASDPRRCLAPDASVKLGVRQHAFDTWKTWEGGAPELAVEILSPSDSPERWTFEEKLERYAAIGVRELVVFDLESPVGSRLRVWDRIDGDLVERVVEDERTPCLTIGHHLLLAPVDEQPVGLRLARDPDGNDLVLTPSERDRKRGVEIEALAAERNELAAERDDARAKIRELERRLAEAGATPPARKP